MEWAESGLDFRGYVRWTLQVSHHRSTQTGKSFEPELQLDTPDSGGQAEGATSKRCSQAELQTECTLVRGERNTGEGRSS